MTEDIYMKAAQIVNKKCGPIGYAKIHNVIVDVPRQRGYKLRSSNKPQDYIAELCIALEHEWKPHELFMIFTSYIDESNTHGKAPDIILGGFLGHAYQWRRFERKLALLQKKYGFSIFHAKDFKVKAKEFKNWSDEKCISLIDDLWKEINDYLTAGIFASLERSRYMEEYRNPPFPDGMHKDSQYGLCFRAILTYLMEYLQNLGNNHKLHIIIEKGHANVGDAQRIFDETKKILEREGITLLGEITPADKRERLLLMTADFLAHTSLMNLREGDHSQIIEESDTLVFPRASKSLSPIQLVFKPGSLQELKENYALNKQRRKDWWDNKPMVSLASLEVQSS